MSVPAHPRTIGSSRPYHDPAFLFLFSGDTEAEKKLVQGGICQSPDSKEFAGSIPVRIGIDDIGKGSDFIYTEDGPVLEILRTEDLIR
jgi:hypothetical protein